MAPSHPSKIRRVLRVLLSPPCALVFAALLAWDASSLPFNTTGAHLVRSVMQPGSRYCIMPLTLQVAKINNTWQVEPSTSPEFNVNLTMTPDPCFWWPVWNSYDTDLGLVRLAHAAEPQGADRDALRLSVCDWFASNGTDTPFTRHLREGEVSFTVVHWWGLARNLGSLLLVAGLCGSLVNAVRWPAQRRAQRRRHGLCSECTYPCLGLPPDAACPECGQIELGRNA